MTPKTITPIVVEEYDRRLAFLHAAYGEARPHIGLINDLPGPEAIATLPLAPLCGYLRKKGGKELDAFTQFEILFGRGSWWCALWVFWHDNDLQRPLLKHAFLYEFAPDSIPFLSLLASSERLYVQDIGSSQGLLLEELKTAPLTTALLIHRIAQRPPEVAP